MSEPGKPSVFLERRSYRRRRFLDAIKLLPILGAWLFLLPVLWPATGADGAATRSTSQALVFVFGGWLALIVMSALFLHNYGKLKDGQSVTSAEDDEAA